MPELWNLVAMKLMRWQNKGVNFLPKYFQYDTIKQRFHQTINNSIIQTYANTNQMAISSLVDINSEESGIRKYFIKAKDMEENYNLLVEAEYQLPALPTKNLYVYGQVDSNKEDGVWEITIFGTNKGRFWIIGISYDGGGISIYTQKKGGGGVEVITQWSNQ